MFHATCRRSQDSLERQNTSLQALVVDLQNRNEKLMEMLVEERKAAAERERDLIDRFLSVASPLAARLIGVGGNRPSTPASPLPGVPRGEQMKEDAAPSRRPLLEPQERRYRSVTQLMDEQRRKEERARIETEEGAGGPSLVEKETEAESVPDPSQTSYLNPTA